MERYINVNDITLKGVAVFDENLDLLIPLSDVRKALQLAPTADVVPRAEVDELIYKLECLLCHATGGKLSKYTYDLKTMETVVTDYINESYSEGVEDGYKDGAAEVAMEIFAEIYSYLTPYPNRCALISLDALAELKKKYTEAEAEPPKESKR